MRGLEELDRAPQRHPNQTSAEVERAVLELRQAHMRWGPRKLRRILERNHPGRAWPATSTVGEIIKRAGLVVARKKRHRAEPYSQPLAHTVESNRVGAPISRAGSRPATGRASIRSPSAIPGGAICCQAVEKANTERGQAIFEAAFREYGLPQAIRTIRMYFISGGA